MHILVIDGRHVEAEFREKFGPEHDYSFVGERVAPRGQNDPTYDKRQFAAWKTLVSAAETAGAAFSFEKNGRTGWNEAAKAGIPLFIEASTAASPSRQHWSAATAPAQKTHFGFCGLPTLLNRSLLEVSLYHEADREKLAKTCAALGTDYRVVDDRVGLVTPRVVCQIINEACYTVQEGTASMADVDLGMRLGTNYPRGPFAWANAIGVARVYTVLEAMWNDTHDERYKICPLLKRQALRGEPFSV